MGSAYSSTNTDLTNYDLSQNLLADYWTNGASTFTSADAISLTTEGRGASEMNAIVPTYPDSPLIILNQDAVNFFGVSFFLPV